MLDIRTLKQNDQEELNRILGKLPSELTKYEKGFIKARRAYLRPEQVQIFEDVLEVKKTETKKVSE